MLLRTVAKCILLAAVVLHSVRSSEASVFDFFFGGIINSFVGGGKTVIKNVGNAALGGGTSIVYDAINLNHFGIGPSIRKYLGIAIEKGGSAALSSSWYLLSKLVSKLFNLVKSGVKALLSLKKDIVWYVTKFFVPIANADDIIVDIHIAATNNDKKDKFRSIRSVETAIVQVLRGRRESVPKYESLKDTFSSATLYDRMQCLPLVMCAIYADPNDFVTPMESKFKKAFRSLFSENSTPIWASQYVRAADIGETSMSTTTCQTSFPSCSFSPGYLRKLISQAMDVYLLQNKMNTLET